MSAPRAVGVALLVLAACGPDLPAVEVAQQRLALTEVTGFGSNPGGLSLHLHEPAGLGPGAPLVVALHGCSQSASGYTAAGWNELADELRFLVAYPQTLGNGGCFEWFTTAQQARTGPQVTSVVQMVQHLVAIRDVDASRVFVTGLSAGGAMANVLLATAPDVFSGGAVMAGVPFACATSATDGLACMSGAVDRSPAAWGALVRAASGSGPAPRVSLWHGTADLTVRVENLQEQLEQWADVSGVDAVADATDVIGTATRRRFTDGAGTVRVETWSIAGMGHGTALAPPACGTQAPFMLDQGLCSTRLAAEFFGLRAPTDAGAGGGTGGTGGGGGSPPALPVGCACGDGSAALVGVALLAFARRASGR